MAKEKMMNEARFSRMVGEFDSLGELIKARQDEKQAIMNEFDKERKRFRAGKISEKTVDSSAKKTNREMARLNKEIRNIIAKSGKMGDGIREFVTSQSPRVFRARVSGIISGAAKKKAAKRKPAKRKAPKKKAAKRAAKRKPAKRAVKRKPVKKAARKPAKRKAPAKRKKK
jgi:hypothetical protein